jgi:hypothetical protein
MFLALGVDGGVIAIVQCWHQRLGWCAFSVQGEWVDTFDLHAQEEIRTNSQFSCHREFLILIPGALNFWTLSLTLG